MAYACEGTQSRRAFRRIPLIGSPSPASRVELSAKTLEAQSLHVETSVNRARFAVAVFCDHNPSLGFISGKFLNVVAAHVEHDA